MIDSENKLIETLKGSESYGIFLKFLPHKIQREKEAWDLIKNNKGNFTEEIMSSIFDKVDYYKDIKESWFKPLLSKPNRNLIYTNSSLGKRNTWFEELLFSTKNLEDRINYCLQIKKIKGASKGLITLLLYLSEPGSYNIWINKTGKGLIKLNRISKLSGNNLESYKIFNQAVIKFRDRFNFKPQEIDWILSCIGDPNYVVSNNNKYIFNEEPLLNRMQKYND